MTFAPQEIRFLTPAVDQTGHEHDHSQTKGEQSAAGKPPGSPLSAMTQCNSNPHLAFHALSRPEAASA
jgi:hypothetical protein